MGRCWAVHHLHIKEHTAGTSYKTEPWNIKLDGLFYFLVQCRSVEFPRTPTTREVSTKQFNSKRKIITKTQCFVYLSWLMCVWQTRSSNTCKVVVIIKSKFSSRSVQHRVKSAYFEHYSATLGRRNGVILQMRSKIPPNNSSMLICTQ